MENQLQENQLQIVTYEQGEKLKLAGFEWDCEFFYFTVNSGKINPESAVKTLLQSTSVRYSDWNGHSKKISAPTVALALKFCVEILREKKVFFKDCINIRTITEEELSKLLDELLILIEKQHENN
jgi:hypothetical protein